MNFIKKTLLIATSAIISFSCSTDEKETQVETLENSNSRIVFPKILTPEEEKELLDYYDSLERLPDIVDSETNDEGSKNSSITYTTSSVTGQDSASFPTLTIGVNSNRFRLSDILVRTNSRHLLGMRLVFEDISSGQTKTTNWLGASSGGSLQTLTLAPACRVIGMGFRQRDGRMAGVTVKYRTCEFGQNSQEALAVFGNAPQQEPTVVIIPDFLENCLATLRSRYNPNEGTSFTTAAQVGYFSCN